MVGQDCSQKSFKQLQIIQDAAAILLSPFFLLSFISAHYSAQYVLINLYLSISSWLYICTFYLNTLNNSLLGSLFYKCFLNVELLITSSTVSCLVYKMCCIKLTELPKDVLLLLYDTDKYGTLLHKYVPHIMRWGNYERSETTGHSN